MEEEKNGLEPIDGVSDKITEPQALEERKEEADGKEPQPEPACPEPEEPQPEPACPEPEEPQPEPVRPEPEKPQPEPVRPEPEEPQPEPVRPEPEKPQPELPRMESIEPQQSTAVGAQRPWQGNTEYMRSDIPQSKVAAGNRGMSIAALVMGILSLICCCCGYLGIACGALGIIFALLSRQDGPMDSKAKTGLVLSGIGLALGLISTVMFLILYALDLWNAAI